MNGIAFPHNPQYYVSAVMTVTRMRLQRPHELPATVDDLFGCSLDAPDLLPCGSVARAANRSGPAPTWTMREE